MTDEPVLMFADDRRIEALASYADRMDELAAVLADAAVGDGELLDRRPAPDAWSVGEVLHHVADSELLRSVDLRRILTEDHPVLGALDPGTAASALLYDARPPADALTVVLALRNDNLRLLASLSPDQWERVGIDQEGGEVDVAGWVSSAVEHLAAHVLQARRAIVGMI